jgi:hypothetical protein
LSICRKFGSSKRFGEGDKKDIIDVLAVKMQLLNEEWERKLDSSGSEVMKLEKIIKNKEGLTKQMSDSLLDFLKNHNRQLTNHAHGMVSTTQHLTEIFDNPPKDDLKKYKDSIEKFLSRVDLILYHRDGLMEERSQCLKALGVKDDRNSLDRVVKQKLSSIASGQNQNRQEPSPPRLQSEVSNMDADEQTMYIKQLNKRLNDMEEAIVEKDDLIKELQMQLKKEHKH